MPHHSEVHAFQPPVRMSMANTNVFSTPWKTFFHSVENSRQPVDILNILFPQSALFLLFSCLPVFPVFLFGSPIPLRPLKLYSRQDT